VVVTIANMGPGPAHEELLRLGEEDLNRVALLGRDRNEEQSQHFGSAGNSFPIAHEAATVLAAAAAAAAKGGEDGDHCDSASQTLLLPPVVRPLRIELHGGDEVRAVLTLPKIEVAPREPPEAPPSLPRNTSRMTVGDPCKNNQDLSFPCCCASPLTVALVDDCSLTRRIYQRKLAQALPGATLLIKGQTYAEIDGFVETVLQEDADVVFLDQNYGNVHDSLRGTDILKAIRSADEASKSPRRLIYVISANDSIDDLEHYMASGADGHISKNASADSIRAVLRRDYRIRTSPRLHHHHLEGTLSMHDHHHLGGALSN
jgi:DNA-binding NarL/FixJ family response regulator